MSRISFRAPGNLSVPTRFFGRFTGKDLVRIGLPLLIALLTISGSDLTIMSAVKLVAAGLFAAFWYGFRPYNKTLDTHLVQAARFLYNGDQEPEVDKNSDHLIIDEETALGVVKVTPTNLEMKTEDEQAALHSIYQNLFSKINYPVQVHSKQEDVSLENYIQNIEERSSESLLREDYVRHIREVSDNQLTATHHYIVARVNHDSVELLQQHLPTWIPGIEPGDELDTENLVNELESRIHDITDAVNTADLTPEQVTGKQLHSLADQLRLQPCQSTAKWSNTQKDGYGEYRRTIYISELPSNIDLGWTDQLLQVNGLVDVTQTIRPKNSADSSKKLQRLTQKLNAEIDSLLRHGYHGTNKLEGLLDDTEWFLDLLADRQDQPVEYAAYITAHHPEQEQAAQTFHQVTNRLDTLQIDYEQPVLRTDQARKTGNVLHPDQLDETQLVPGQTAAAGFPFATQDTEREHGVIYGTNGQGLVLADRFQWSSHSMARMGMVGSGKSYAAKLELLRARLAYNDLQIIIVDPKQEYRQITRALNGKIVTLSEDTSIQPGQHDVINYTVEERGQTDDIPLLVNAVEKIYQATSQHPCKTLVLIDEARILLNDEQGRTVLNRFILEARDTNTAVTLITQNASHFTHHRKGREILDNMPGKIFMRHDRVPDSVTEYFDLSNREKQELYELKTGTESPYSEALLKITGKLDTRIKIQSTSQEHAIIQNQRGEQ